MLMSLLPTTVFAADDPSVTMTASYDNDSELSEVTATDEGTIKVSFNYTKSTGTGSTIAIDLPYGVDLVDAPGVAVSGTTVTCNNNYEGSDETYLSAATWDAKTALTAVSTSGTLTYNLGSSDGGSFYIEVAVNADYVPMSNTDAAEVITLGDITATLTDTSDSSTYNADPVTIKAKGQPANAVFSSFTVREYVSAANEVGSTDSIKTTLVDGNTDTVMLNMVLAIDSAFADGGNSTMYASYPTFTLEVPAGSEVTPITTYHSADYVSSDGVTDTYTITVKVDGAGVYSGKINRGDIVMIELPDSSNDTTDTSDVIVTGGTIKFTVSDLKIPITNRYDGEEFKTITYTSDDTAVATIDVIEFDPTYSISSSTSTNRKEASNNFYYPDDGETYETYWENVTDQTLMSFYRAFDTYSTPETDGSISTTPVKFSLVAEKMPYDATTKESGDSYYLDIVNQVNLTVPFIGESNLRQTNELLSLTIITDKYKMENTGTEADLYDTYGTVEYKFTADEIAAFNKAVVDNGATAIGSSYNFGAGGQAIGSSGIVEYYWNSAGAYAPMFIIDAPEGESIISVVAEFSGDTDAFATTNTGYTFKVLGYPKSPEIRYDTTVTNGNYSGYKSLYTFSVYQDADGDYDEVDSDGCETSINLFSGNSSVSTDYYSCGFLWLVPNLFDLTVTTGTNSTAYMYNTTEAGYVSGGYDTYNSSYGLQGYQLLGYIDVQNTTEALPRGEIIATADIDTENGDIVKEIFFPYLSYSGVTSEVTALTYTLVPINSTTGKLDTTVTSYDGMGEWTLTNPADVGVSTYGRIVAPDGYAFESFSVTLEGWSSSKNTGTTSTFQLRGYLANSDELFEDASGVNNDQGTTADTHKLTISTEATRYSGTVHETTVDTKFYTADTTYATMDVLNTSSVSITGGDRYETTVLRPGVATDVQFNLFGGQNSKTFASSWHDIVFTVVLPDTVTLNDISIGDFKLEHYTSANSVTYEDTGESAGDLETVSSLTNLTDVAATITSSENYFDVSMLGTATGAEVYQFKLSDDDVNLYWTRHGNGSYDTHTSMTVTMNVTADIDAAGLAIPWSDVLILGTDCEEIE